MRAAQGPIHRLATAEAAYHDFEQESVVVVRCSHHVIGTTSHQVIPLSIEAATQLYSELGTALGMGTRSCQAELESRIQRMEDRFQLFLETHNLWDGS